MGSAKLCGRADARRRLHTSVCVLPMKSLRLGSEALGSSFRPVRYALLDQYLGRGGPDQRKEQLNDGNRQYLPRESYHACCVTTLV